MIEIFFIIDFLENILIQRPKGSKKRLKSLMSEIKTKCVNNCKQPNFRYIEHIKSDTKYHKLMAKTNDDNVIIGVIVSESYKTERHIWDLITKTSELLKDIEIENKNELNDLKPQIDDLIADFEAKKTGENFDNKFRETFSKVENMIKKAEDSSMDLVGICTTTDDILDDAVVFNEDGGELYKASYWYNKKVTIFLIGLCFVLFVIVAIFIWNLFK